MVTIQNIQLELQSEMVWKTGGDSCKKFWSSDFCHILGYQNKNVKHCTCVNGIVQSAKNSSVTVDAKRCDEPKKEAIRIL